MKSTKWILHSVVFLLVGLALVACQTDDTATVVEPDTVVEADTVEEDAPQVDEADAAAPSALDTVTISYAAEPTNIDPPQGGGITENVFTSQIFDGLVRRDAAGDIVPHLAESWEQLDDTTWRFHLVDGVKFHNGEPVNADAVVFGIERYKADISLQASRFTNILEAQVVDDLTVDIILESPDPILPNSFVNNLYPMPRKYIEEMGDEFVGANPIGSGPYQFVEWVRGSHLTLKAYPDYWRGVPSIPNVVFRPITEPATRVAALLSGEVDLIWEVPPAMADIIRTSDIAVVKSVPGPRAVYIGLWPTGTTEAPQLNDPLVRKAINHAINRQGMVDNLLYGFATLLGQPIPSLYLGHNPDVPPYEYDPDLARELLAEAGYPDGFEVNMDYALRWLTPEQAQVVQADLAKVGITLNINQMEPSTFINELIGGNVAPMFSLSIQGRVGIDADEIFQVAVICDGSFNWVDYCNPEVDELIKKGRESSDLVEREAFFQQAIELIHEDAPWVYMWNNNSIWGVGNRLDWTPRSDDQLFVFDDVKPAAP